MPQHSRTLRVSFGETDAAGIMYYPNYLRWFDQGTHDLFGSLGYSSRTLLEDGIAIAVIDVHARYLTSLRLDDEVTVTSRIAEVRTRAFRVEHQIRRGNQLVCEGHEVRMWVRIADPSGRVQPENLPDDIRLALLAGGPGACPA
ncbi:MAG: tol-pal system-associated acyl-CoA thioesterase [Chloroflexota bacterium]